MTKTWPVQDVKARLSEVLRHAEVEPQIISYRGKPKFELRRIEDKPAKKPKSLYEALRACPYEFEIPPRDKRPGRDIEL